MGHFNQETRSPHEAPVLVDELKILDGLERCRVVLDNIIRTLGSGSNLAPMVGDLLTLGQCAQAAGVSRSLIRSEIKEGFLPAVGHERYEVVRVRRNDFVVWLDQSFSPVTGSIRPGRGGGRPRTKEIGERGCNGTAGALG